MPIKTDPNQEKLNRELSALRQKDQLEKVEELRRRELLPQRMMTAQMMSNAKRLGLVNENNQRNHETYIIRRREDIGKLKQRISLPQRMMEAQMRENAIKLGLIEDDEEEDEEVERYENESDDNYQRRKAIDREKKKSGLISKKINNLKNLAKSAGRRMIKPIADKGKQLAAQAARIIAQGLARAVVWLAGLAVGAAVGAIGVTGVIVLLVVIVAIAVVSQTCDSNSISSAICGIASWVSGLF